jgi:hypothetical protein
MVVIPSTTLRTRVVGLSWSFAVKDNSVLALITMTTCAKRSEIYENCEADNGGESNFVENGTHPNRNRLLKCRMRRLGNDQKTRAYAKVKE